MTADNPPLTLTLASDLRLLPVARAFVEAACQVAGFDGAAAHAVVLAADEASNNIIRHAHRNDGGKLFHIRIYLSADAVEVQLIDEGPPFDLSAVPELDPGELRVGGRGVFLMRTLMDEVSCQPYGARGNLLRLVKRRPQPSAAAGPT
ncbi:MAG TPA: ATP-binding protein [Gemmataceae bacterium]|nr:ATP-binding protein [Gemmataceae bacterium]